MSKITNPDVPTRIEGKIISVDGQETEFAIATDLAWQQWGNSQDVCSRNVELLDALAQASLGHLQDEIEREYDYEVQGLYEGEWEMVTTETTPEEAHERRREYQEAEPGIAFRVERVEAS